MTADALDPFRSVWRRHRAAMVAAAEQAGILAARTRADYALFPPAEECACGALEPCLDTELGYPWCDYCCRHHDAPEQCEADQQ